MSVDSILLQLEDEIQDLEEETFLLFARPIPSQNLGFIDPKASTVEVNVTGRDLTIHQSPGVLSSSRSGGTTGAVLWKITPLFASFIPSSPLRTLLSPKTSSVLELGCGISPLTALALSSHVKSYILTDQPYVQKFVTLNIDENHQQQQQSGSRKKGKGRSEPTSSAEIRFTPLDWESDVVTSSLSPTGSFDLVIACDCVYNDALVRPLVQTCVDACRLKAERVGSGGDESGSEPCVCVVAQQLRSDDVFQQWLTEFAKHFRVWRFPDGLLPSGLQPDDGFVVHAGILRD